MSTQAPNDVTQSANTPGNNAATVFAGWSTDAPVEQRQRAFDQIARECQNIDVFCALILAIEGVDAELHRWMGGDIHAAVLADTAASDVSDQVIEEFDLRYARLLNRYSRYDLAHAKTFLARSERLYKAIGRSYIRFQRLGGSIDTTLEFFDRFVRFGASIESVSTLYNPEFKSRVIQPGVSIDEFLDPDKTESNLIYALLEQPFERQVQQVSMHDHAEKAESMWVDLPRLKPIDSAHFYIVSNARVTMSPSCIVFEENAERHIIGMMSDMYHHSQIAGRIGVKDITRMHDQAYFLPRFGPPKNHYHSLIDKLPGLFGYRLLDLDCPIVSGYELNDTEKYFADQMGIDPDKIYYDSTANVVARRGIVGRSEHLRSEFYGFCANLPRTTSPCGTHIYISRGDASGRGMANETEIEALLADQGFDIVSMEHHDLQSQIAILANATCVVAPHGAGLANMIFSKPGCQIIELIPERYMVRFFWQLALDCGHAYSVLIGDMLEDNDAGIGDTLRWKTDPDALLAVLADARPSNVAA